VVAKNSLKEMAQTRKARFGTFLVELTLLVDMNRAILVDPESEKVL
jgi:hypothetical protein